MKYIKIWQVEIFGSKVIYTSLDDAIESLKCDLEDLEDNQREPIVISTKEITETQFNNLPEFEGY